MTEIEIIKKRWVYLQDTETMSLVTTLENDDEYVDTMDIFVEYNGKKKKIHISSTGSVDIYES